MKDQHESGVITYSDAQSIEARSKLFNHLKDYKASETETERSLGLFLRGSLLARLFAIREVYEKIVSKPGVILDIGTWRGQTAVLCENLRAIFEPLHFNRRIIAFDTFEGYSGFSDKDKPTQLHQNGTYKLEVGYDQYLRELLEIHEKNNAMGHNFGKHQVIKGDCRVTVAEFLEKNPNEFISLAFFDVNSYEPTSKTFPIVYERLVEGGVVAFWQLTRSSIPAEGAVYNNAILDKIPHTLWRSQFYPGLCYLIKE